MDKLLKNATIIDNDGELHRGKNLLILGGTISKVYDELTPEDERAIEVRIKAGEIMEVDCSRYYISSGIVNLHTHMGMNIFKGIAEDVNADDWFNKMVFPYESKMEGEDIYMGTLLAACEMISNGVTAACDHYFGEEQVLRAVKEAGIRCDIAPTLFGSAPDYKDRLDAACDFVSSHRNDSDRISFRMGPHADYTCPPDTLKQMADVARDMNLGVHIHYADDKKTNDFSLANYGKSSAVILKESGILDCNVILAHGLWLTEDILPYLTDNCILVSCPKTYMKMGLGKGRFIEYASRFKYGFGTDGAASSATLSPVEQARLFALLGKYEDNAEGFKVREIWKRLMGGADVLEFGTGHLTEGAPADLVIWDLNTPDTMPVYDPVAAILYSSNSSNVRYTMVGGDFLKADGRLTLDYDSIVKEAESLRRALLKRGRGEAKVTFLV